ncbi:hypothetical protein ACFX19_008012 [Malus domestica]
MASSEYGPDDLSLDLSTDEMVVHFNMFCSFRYRLVCRRDGTERNGTGRNGEGAKMPSDGNKEEEGDGEVIIFCSTDMERVVSEGRQNENSPKIRHVE